MVNVNVEAASDVFTYGIGEDVVGFAECCRSWIFERFSVLISFAEEDVSLEINTRQLNCLL